MACAGGKRCGDPAGGYSRRVIARLDLEDLKRKNYGEDEARSGWLCLRTWWERIKSGCCDYETGARRWGALMFIDAVQLSRPHGLIDVKALDCDFLGVPRRTNSLGRHMGTAVRKARTPGEVQGRTRCVRPRTLRQNAGKTGTQVQELIAGIGAGRGINIAEAGAAIARP